MSEGVVRSLLHRRSQVGRWAIDPNADEISSQGQVIKLEPRAMRLLLYLIEHRDRVVALNELLDNVWANVVVTPQSVYSTIAQLRHALGDSVGSPAYIGTVPRKGYRLLASVTEIPVAQTPLAVPRARSARPQGWGIVLAATALGIPMLIYHYGYRNSAVNESAVGQAHNLSLECQFYRERNTVVDGDKAVGCFRRLTDMNPDSARAWAGYADALMRRPMLGGAAIDVQRAAGMESVKAARHALALDPNSAAAHAVIANFLRIFEHDWGGADSEVKAALAADPNDPTTLLSATALARDLGHLDQLIELCERARINDPLNFQPYARLGAAYLYLGRFDEAETMARRRLDLSPNGSGSRMQLAEVLLARGHPQDALAEIAHEPHESLRQSGDAMAYFALGQRKEADSALADMITRFADLQPTHIAEILAFRGDTDRAFDFLSKAAASGDRNLLDIKSNYYFRSVHADPRYRALLHRLSLPEEN